MNTTHSNKRQCVADICAGGEVRSVFLLGAASMQQAKNGPFWKLELRDATGILEARIWSPLSQTVTELAPGHLTLVEGRADLFRDQLQVSVHRVQVLAPEERAGLNMAEFIPASERPAEDMLADIETMCRKILTHKPWRKLMDSILKDEAVRARLMVAPAAKSVHHNWAGGLLEHMLGVAKLCMSMADLYPELDRQTLLVGALVHDIGKLWELSGELVTDYTDEGRLIGHITIGATMLEAHIRKSGLEPELAMHLRHLILSHHGLPEYGAAREPLTAEAFALHHADNIDAKLVQCRSLFDDAVTPDEGAWSPYQATLRRAIYKAPRSPKTEKGESAKKDKPLTREEQCSLL